MNRLTRFPRAEAGQPYVLDGDLYNDIVDAIEWCMRIGVQHPLMLQDINGPRISFQRTNTQAVLQLTSARAVFSTSKGAARYNAAIGTGTVTNLDPDSNFVPPDASMNFPSSPNAIAVDVYEGGSAASGTCVVGVNSIVLGTLIGSDNETPSLPVYYFSSAPAGTNFVVNLTQTGGSQGSSTSAASWTYTGSLSDGSGLQLFANGSPLAGRGDGQLTPATYGVAYIDNTGVIQFLSAYEVPVYTFC